MPPKTMKMTLKATQEVDNKRQLLHDPTIRKFLPAFAGSPFGEFPSDYTMPNKKYAAMRKAEAKAAANAASQNDATARLAVSTDDGSPKHSFLKSHGGRGGNPTTTAPQFEAPAPKKPVAGAFRRREIPPTDFRRFYERGDLPITIQHRGNGRKLDWKVDIEKLDFHHYLPIFFDGLREKEEPYKFLASQGCYDMLAKGGPKILPTIPQLIIPVKVALNTRDPDIICAVLKVLQKLVVSGELIGEALVPYYRQILPILNMYRAKGLNLGDGIDYGQRKQNNMGDLIQDTLQALEKYGGEDAFINIKYIVPTYESCVLN